MVYGAAKSIGYLLRYSRIGNYDILCDNKLFHKYGEAYIREYTNNRVQEIFCANLPFLEKALWYSSINKYGYYKYLKMRISNSIVNIKYFTNKNKIAKIIKSGNYDVIYLNAFTLARLIRKQKHFIIHARDLCNIRKNRILQKALAEVKAIICIDEAVKQRIQEVYPHVYENKLKVIMNPFNMSSEMNIINEAFKIHLEKLVAGRIAIALIGIIDKTKGCDFVLNVFKKNKRVDLCFLMIGNGDSDIINICKRFSSEDDRIFYIPETKDIYTVYRNIDYVVRGDEVFCTGRTVFESLYSGCGVILQGQTNDVRNIFGYQEFSDKIIMYSPRNAKSLQDVFNSVDRIPFDKRQLRNNIDEHIVEVQEIIQTLRS